ncbi:MAG: hypothetical protein ACC645_18120 [Pirellulales bacterium]
MKLRLKAIHDALNLDGRAGVREYWLIDARSQELFFQIHHRGARSFDTVPAQADRFRRSDVLDRSYRLDRDRHKRGHWVHRLRSQ